MRKDKISINITKIQETGKVKAYVTFLLNDCFIVHDARIIEGDHGLFVAMPSRKTNSGFKDICHPITKDLRESIEYAIIAEYQKNILERKDY